MLSDVLFDAVAAIEEWELTHPIWYAEHAEAIAAVKQAMTALRERLEGDQAGKPPPDTDCFICGVSLEARNAVRGTARRTGDGSAGRRSVASAPTVSVPRADSGR